MLADALFAERRAGSLESWTGTLDALPDDIWDAMTEGGGASSESGETVSHKAALETDTWWRAINMVSTDIASTPRHVYRRLPEGGKERATDHPAERLIRRRANPQMKAFDLFQTLQAHKMTYGNGYAYVVRRGDGMPVELWILDPSQTYPVRVDGELTYTHTAAGQTWRIDAADMIHIKGLGFDGLVGYDVRTYARHTLGLATAMRKHASFYFKQGAQPSCIVEHPTELSQAARKNIREGLAKLYSGVDKHYRVAVIDQGMQAKWPDIDAQKAQLVEGRKFSVREVSNFTGVPPHKLGDDSRISYNSLEAEDRAYQQQALNGSYVQIEEELSEKLLTEPQLARDTHFVEFVREALVSVDFATKVEGAVKQLNNGVLNGDEVRELFNRPAMPDGVGRKFRMPVNIGFVGETAPMAAGPLRQLALGAVHRVAHRFAERARRLGGDREKIEAKVLSDKWDGEAREDLIAGLAPVIELVGDGPTAESIASDLIHRWKQRIKLALRADGDLPTAMEAALRYVDGELCEEIADEVMGDNHASGTAIQPA